MSKKIKRLIDWRSICRICKFRRIAISDDNDCGPYVVVTCGGHGDAVTKEANPDNCLIWKQLETDENEGPPEK